MVGEIAGPAVGSVAAVERSPQKLFSAENGTAVFGVVPSSWTLIAPYALSRMLLRAAVDAAAPTRRTPAPSGRLALLVAAPRVGAPVPWTRFWLIVFPVSATLAPAVTRTPSWPYSGPVVVRLLPGEPVEEQLPLAVKLVHTSLPTMLLFDTTPRLTTPDAV